MNECIRVRVCMHMGSLVGRYVGMSDRMHVRTDGQTYLSIHVSSYVYA